MKPKVQKRDGGWQLVLPAPTQRFGFTSRPAEPRILVRDMATPADCMSLLRTDSNMCVHDGWFTTASPPKSLDVAGEGFRPVVQ